MGGSSSNGGTPRAAVEAPNTLISNTRIRILDLVGEGTQAGFWVQSGISGGNPLCSMYMDDTPILNGDGSPNFNISGQGFSWGYVSGTSGQSYIEGFDKVEALVPLPANTRVTFPPENNGFPKPVVVAFNTTMYPDAEGVKVTMRIPQLFTVNQTNGDTNLYNIGWLVECQLNGGEWQTLDTQNINGKCTSPFLKTLVYPLPKTDPISTFYEWKVRIRRTTQMVLSSSTANDLYVDSIAIVSSNSYRYPMSAMVGLSLSADQFAGIPVRAYDVKGIQVLVPEGYTPTQYGETTFQRQCDYDSGNKLIGFTTQSASETAGVVPGVIVSGPGIPPGSIVISVDNDGPSYFFAIDQDPTSTLVNQTVTFTSITPGTITPAVYPSIWTGTFGARQWTDNPAWIFYDLCTNKRYGLGNYVRPEWMDKWTLYQIAQFCDEMVDDGNGGLEPRFTCNVAIQEPQDAYTLLNNLVSVFRGMLYWSNGRIMPVGSETRDPVFNFTNANVIGGAFSYSDTPRNTRSTVCLIRWNDPDNLFRSSVERVEDPDGLARYGEIKKEVTSFATTSRGQAARAANWILTVEQLLTETVSFSTDMEGVYLRPGDVFNVYDNYRNNQQQGGRIVSFSAARDAIELDKEVTLFPGFYYDLAALVPAATIGTGITGSNQIAGLRNSQVETRRVVTSPGTGLYTVALDSGFSANLYKGSVWILSASGSAVTIFDQATQYKVLGASEPQNGITQVVGVEYNTGVNFLVNNNYNVEISPPIAGDTTPPAPPTGLSATRITGLLIDNTFFSYVYLDWTGSVSPNAAYHTITGRLGVGTPFVVGSPPASQTEINYTPSAPGTYTFGVAAYNANGYGSAFNEVTYVEPATNPLPTTPLSGIFISEDFDPYTKAVAPLNRYTGYIGTTPTFGWNIEVDPTNGLETPSAQFITGYRVRLLDITNEASVLAPEIILEGKEIDSWKVPEDYLYTVPSITPLRAFTLSVDTLTTYGDIRSGARLAVNNPQPPPPVNSGFIGFDGGVSYNITPSRLVDLSGVYIWNNVSPSFTPTYDNVTFSSTNFAGFAPVYASNPDGSFSTWFSLLDTYGYSGSTASNGDSNAKIYGPISGNVTAVFGSIDIDISSEINAALATISGAFSLLTGTFTDSLLTISGENQQTLLMVQGFSGQIIGAIPGEVNTALTVRVDTAVTSSSGSLAQQINAVQANMVTTGQILTAQVGAVSTALTQTGISLGQRIDVVTANLNTTNSNVTATGATLLSAIATSNGALAQWITNLGVQTTGAYATVRIGAEAMVTGSDLIAGTGGVAIARWGFELDANGKVVSMRATSSSFPGNYGTIVFGNANLQSNTYSAGSAGWQISADGNVDFNNASIRGAFTGGSAASNFITADDRGFASRTNGASDRVEISTAGTNAKAIAVYNNINSNVVNLGSVNFAGNYIGELTLRDHNGVTKALINGQGGAVFGGNVEIDGIVQFDGATTHNAQLNINSSNKVHFSAAGTNVSYINEDNGINLYGDSSHPIRIRGAALLLNESAVGSFNAGWVYDLNGNNILRERYGATPSTLSDVITILQYHGLSD